MSYQTQKSSASGVEVVVSEGKLVKIVRRLFSRAAVVSEASKFEDRLDAGEEEILSTEESRRTLSESLQVQERLLRELKPSK